MIFRKTFLLASLALPLALPAFSASLPVDLSPAQASRPRSPVVAEAQRLLSPNARFAKEGVLTVATTVGVLPFSDYATDNRTPVGNAPDIAQLIADSLGRRLELVSVAWADWPLGLQSGKYDLVVSNVTVTEERKEKFDFSTYRNDQLGVYVRSDSKIRSIKDPRELAGLRVIVGSATNQEQILLRWNQQNVAAGLKPVEILYFDDPAVLRLALQSGRADAHFAPNGWAAFEARDGKTRLVGTFSGGWPLTAEIAAAARKGSGLADAVTAAINAQIRNGNYAKALSRWSLESEAIAVSRTNPPGLPKP
ncbi:ABC transporter substrate-binding protein [Pelomonas aquatica]|jgi:polar amino acid transport system substrate-binding protein|uniref:ABC transporter substrate-binding protein n=1 Tax=Pelomonas aquatica TaxID=431058 RepID=A0A9X4R4R1_9BURK|nr:ABC transporter substrate-binding protein [Pelomonas aquatica]MCY4754125.1 ABC transporter substrate-binding protein [Pelomonas aquatica]MDG0862424.1 ABC transporter substrate-binding protein [Pelomonas aquatica]